MAVVATLVAKLNARTATFQRKMRRADRTVDRSRAKQQSLIKTNRLLGSSYLNMSGIAVGAIAAIVAAVGTLIIAFKSVKVFAGFEQKMARVRAVSGATVNQFQDMIGVAKQLGATTAFSATQAAEGMGFLAQAGFKVNEIVGAMPDVLNLAAAAQIDLARASDITTNILTGFGMSVGELARANDILVSTFTGTNVSLEQLGEAFKLVGPVAKAVGVTFEQTSVLIGALGNAGIQGSLAGTSLRRAMVSLIAPSNQQAAVMKRFGLNTLVANGQVKDMIAVLDKLKKGGANTADIMQLFSLRAGPAMAALMSQGTEALRELEMRLERSGGLAEKIATQQLDTLQGAWTIMKSKIEAVAISLGEIFAPVALLVVRVIGAMADAFINHQDVIRAFIAVGLVLLVKFFETLVLAVLLASSTFTDFVARIAFDFARLTKWFANFFSILDNLPGKAGKMAASMVSALRNMSASASNFSVDAQKINDGILTMAVGVTDAVKGMGASFDKIFSSVGNVGKEIDDNSKKVQQFANVMGDAKESVTSDLQEIKMEFESLGDFIGTVWDDIAAGALSKLGSAGQSLVDLIQRGRKVGETIGADLGARGGLGVGAGGIEGAIQGAQVGGTAGALAGAFLALISESKTFTQAMAIINSFMQKTADTFGKLLQPLLPLIGIIGKFLNAMQLVNPIFLVLKVSMQVLMPIFKVLFQVVRRLGIMILKVAKFFADVFFGGSKGINKALRDLRDATWDNVNATNEMADAASRAAGELFNMVEGIKLALFRFLSAQGQLVPPGATVGSGFGGSFIPPGAPTPPPGTLGGADDEVGTTENALSGTTIIQIERIVIEGATDPELFIEKVIEGLEGKNLLAEGKPFLVSLPGLSG